MAQQIEVIVTLPHINIELPITIDEDATVLEFKALLASNTELDVDNVDVIFNKRLLFDNMKLAFLSEERPLKLIARPKNYMPLSQNSVTAEDSSAIPIDPNDIQIQLPPPPKLLEADIMIASYRSDALLRERINLRNPELAKAIETNDIPQIERLLLESYRRDMKEYTILKNKYIRIKKDPYGAEAQAEIEKVIKNQQIDENYQKAMDETPEVFGVVQMLYIPVTVNKHSLVALVDTGAQSTIMSDKCCERCNLTHLLDTRFSGVARGVGTGKIIGRVHAIDIKACEKYAK
eukprot:MONOS_3490.1-p1 / transcript=MONOS_3490.1 / gene=MONOS_3490 / organism=Monocercomonoides_exilis_PA203 / gene_product=DNA damage-inducible v-SNARE binding protein Ddi1, putative / transcript_product=DNA damage-inducible v-SNARE binding protein Ddi1, putative / location=Mono_scaffold00082:128182-129421(+) / protein_length=290 / sequence_SO=supercontig / SO=protein_coding / is_pseudo=false